MSKAGLLHLTKGLAKSLAPDVRVNAIAPGLMLTEWAAGFSEEQVKLSTDAALLKGVSEVPDVAAVYSESGVGVRHRSLQEERESHGRRRTG